MSRVNDGGSAASRATLWDIRLALHRIRAQARAGEAAAEGLVAANDVELEALFDTIAVEVDALLERTEYFDGTGKAPRESLAALATEVEAARRECRRHPVAVKRRRLPSGEPI